MTQPVYNCRNCKAIIVNNANRFDGGAKVRLDKVVNEENIYTFFLCEKCLGKVKWLLGL